jgi:hypothetical protein
MQPPIQVLFGNPVVNTCRRNTALQFDAAILKTTHQDPAATEDMVTRQVLPDWSPQRLVEQAWTTNGPENSVAGECEKDRSEATYFQEGTFSSLNARIITCLELAVLND